MVIGLVGWVAASPRLGKDAALILAELKKWSGATDAELKGEFSWDEFQFQAALKELQSHLGDELLIKKRGGWSEYSLKNKKRK